MTIIELKKELGITWLDLSKALGVSLRTMYYIRQGKASDTIKALIRCLYGREID